MTHTYVVLLSLVLAFNHINSLCRNAGSEASGPGDHGDRGIDNYIKNHLCRTTRICEGLMINFKEPEDSCSQPSSARQVRRKTVPRRSNSVNDHNGVDDEGEDEDGEDDEDDEDENSGDILKSIIIHP
jgi:hypothetical protein